MRVIGTHRDTVLGVAFSPDGKVALSTSMREHVVLWDVKKESARVGGFGTGTGCVCWTAAMSKSGRVAAGFGNVTFQMWDRKTDTMRELPKLGGIVASLAWSADGKRLFTGNCGDNTVRSWDAKGTVTASGTTKKSATWFVALSPDGKIGVSGAGDKLVHVWDADSCTETAQLSGHLGKILSLAFFPDGKRVASAAQDKTVRLWDLARRTELACFAGHKKQVTSVAVSRDGARVASASSDGTIRIWNPKTREAERVIEGAPASAVAFSPTHDTLLAGCTDGTVRLFDPT